MKIITITSDLGNKGSYLASLKGSIYSQIDNVRIVDIDNEIDPFNIQQGAFILQNCYKNFPKGTIHIISIDDELSINNEHIAAYIDGHFFIGADNGFFSLFLTNIAPDKIVKLNITQTSDVMTFAAKNIFSIAACHLARGGTMEIIGTKVEKLENIKSKLSPIVKKDLLQGSVIFTDIYGNAITNITKDIFNNACKGRSFSILFGREDETISVISNKYKDVPLAEKLALFTESNYLQIAINQGKASELLGLSMYEIIRIEFK